MVLWGVNLQIETPRFSPCHTSKTICSAGSHCVRLLLVGFRRAPRVLGGLDSRGLLDRASKQNDDTRSAAAEEGKLQISRVFDLAAKLTKLVRRCVNGISSEIRKGDLNVKARHLRLTDVQQLSSDNEAVVLPVRF